MTWLLFSLMSGSFYTLSNLISRYVLKGKQDAWAFSFFFSLMGAVATLPFVLYTPRFSGSIYAWLVVALLGILIVCHNYLFFRANNYLPASVVNTLTKLRPAWVFIFALVIGTEVFSLSKSLALIMLVASGVILSGKFKSNDLRKGLFFAISSTLIFAIVTIGVKEMFFHFNQVSLTFLIFAFPTLYNFVFMPHRVTRIKSLFINNKIPVVVAGLAGGLANLSAFWAYSLGSPTEVLLIIESFLIVTLVGEHLILKEKENLFAKMGAVILALLGMLLIAYSK